MLLKTCKSGGTDERICKMYVPRLLLIHLSDQCSISGKTQSNNGESLLPTINGYGVVLDINFFDIDNNGTTEIILSRTGDDVNGQGWYKGWYIQVLEIENSLYVDKTNKFIDDFSSPNDYENYRLHIAEIDGEIKLFNDQLELKQDGYNDDIKYKVWKLTNGKFILQ